MSQVAFSMNDKQLPWIDRAQKLPEEREYVLICLELPQGNKPGIYELAVYQNGSLGRGFYVLPPTIWQINSNRDPKLVSPSSLVLYWMRIPNPVQQ